MNYWRICRKKEPAAMGFIQAPEYNIDEMDSRSCMISLDYSGCFCLCSTKYIDPQRPGMVYIDKKATAAPLIKPPMSMFGTTGGQILCASI